MITINVKVIKNGSHILGYVTSLKYNNSKKLIKEFQTAYPNRKDDCLDGLKHLDNISLSSLATRWDTHDGYLSFVETDTYKDFCNFIKTKKNKEYRIGTVKSQPGLILDF